jgi:signal transduction histidine kinase
MSDSVIRTLLIEDNHGDARLIELMLAETGDSVFQLTWVDKLALGLARLPENAFDIILLDLSLPDSTGLKTYTAIHEKAQQIPIILLTGLSDQLAALEAVQMGAQDYLIKGQITGNHLRCAMMYAIERLKLMTASVEKEKMIFQVERMEEINSILAGIAHNFNNPLFAASGFLTRLKRKTQLLPDQMELVGRIEQQINRMGALLADFAVLINNQVITRNEIKINDILNEILRDADSLSSGKQVRFQTELTTDTIIIGNAMEIKQAIISIINNAVEAISASGLIIIRTLVQHNAESSINIIEIEDNGRGMAAEERRRIFDPFFTTKEGVASRGLGMSIAQRIIKRHDGEILVQSEKEKGTKVSILLRASLAAVPPCEG